MTSPYIDWRSRAGRKALDECPFLPLAMSQASKRHRKQEPGKFEFDELLAVAIEEIKKVLPDAVLDDTSKGNKYLRKPIKGALLDFVRDNHKVVPNVEMSKEKFDRTWAALEPNAKLLAGEGKLSAKHPGKVSVSIGRSTYKDTWDQKLGGRVRAKIADDEQVVEADPRGPMSWTPRGVSEDGTEALRKKAKKRAEKKGISEDDTYDVLLQRACMARGGKTEVRRVNVSGLREKARKLAKKKDVSEEGAYRLVYAKARRRPVKREPVATLDRTAEPEWRLYDEFAGYPLGGLGLFDRRVIPGDIAPPSEWGMFVSLPPGQRRLDLPRGRLPEVSRQEMLCRKWRAPGYSIGGLAELRWVTRPRGRRTSAAIVDMTKYGMEPGPQDKLRSERRKLAIKELGIEGPKAEAKCRELAIIELAKEVPKAGTISWHQEAGYFQGGGLIDRDRSKAWERPWAELTDYAWVIETNHGFHWRGQKIFSPAVTKSPVWGDAIYERGTPSRPVPSVLGGSRTAEPPPTLSPWLNSLKVARSLNWSSVRTAGAYRARSDAALRAAAKVIELPGEDIRPRLARLRAAADARLRSKIARLLTPTTWLRQEAAAEAGWPVFHKMLANVEAGNAAVAGSSGAIELSLDDFCGHRDLLAVPTSFEPVLPPHTAASPLLKIAPSRRAAQAS